MKKQYTDRYVSDGTSALASKPCEFVLLDGKAAVTQIKALSVRTLQEQQPHSSYQPFSVRQLFVAALVLVSVLSVFVSAYNLRMTAIENGVLTRLQSTPTETITVKSGDSLWKIAEEHEVTGVSTADTVRYIQSINHISADELVPGQSLRIPAVR